MKPTNDPIYDTKDEGCNIAEFWLYEQPNYSMIQEQPYLQVQKGDFRIQDTTKIFQLWISLICGC